MIHIDILNRDKKLKGFSIKGHAYHNNIKNDYVCSALSFLSTTIVNTVDDYNINFSFTDDGDKFEFIIDNPCEKSDIILKTFITGALSLMDSYEEFIDIHYKNIWYGG